MKRDDARQQVLDILGWNASPVVSAKIESAFRFVQNELESEATLPFFLRRIDKDQVTVNGESVIQRPDDFIRLWNENPFQITVGEVIFSLVQGPQNLLRKRFTDTTRPMGFTEIGEEFHLFPIPTAEYPLIFTYYAQDEVLWVNIENKWLKYLPGLMIGRAGFIVASGMRDQAAQQLFGGMAAAGTEKLNQMSTAQDESGSKPVMMGED